MSPSLFRCPRLILTLIASVVIALSPHVASFLIIAGPGEHLRLVPIVEIASVGLIVGLAVWCWRKRLPSGGMRRVLAACCLGGGIVVSLIVIGGIVNGLYFGGFRLGQGGNPGVGVTLLVTLNMLGVLGFLVGAVIGACAAWIAGTEDLSPNRRESE